MPGLITKEMIREQKKQILRQEKSQAQKELEHTPTTAPAEKEDPALVQKRKMAEAIRAVVKAGQKAKESEEEKQVCHGVLMLW